MPDDVSITGALRSTARWMRNRNATCNFWRAAENLSITPTGENSPDVWAVSQGTALRRVHIKGSVNLWDGGWASGGFMADSLIDGRVDSGTQQQWLSRNSEWGTWVGSSWNMVFVGDLNSPQGEWPKLPDTVIDSTPLIAEKPYLYIDKQGDYAVFVPSLHLKGTRGTTWSKTATDGRSISIDDFYVAHPDIDSSETLNAALTQGKNLLFTPGNYHLDASISVSRPGTVILGIGYPTLTPDKGTPVFALGDVDGLRLGGFLLEAGAVDSPVLLQVGEPGSSLSHSASPTFLYDIFCRAGGAASRIRRRSFVTINSANVVGDNFWLWRADHGKGASWYTSRNAHGLIVNGRDVTVYGLFVEHCQEYQTLWNGDGGRVYFYQSEMPYDPPSSAGLVAQRSKRLYKLRTRSLSRSQPTRLGGFGSLLRFLQGTGP